jgi:hypothetical protein
MSTPNALDPSLTGTAGPLPIHAELQRLAGPNPGFYLSKEFVRVLVLDRFVQAISKLTGGAVVFILGEQELLATRIARATFSTAVPGENAIFIEDNNDPQSVKLELRSDLTVVAEVFIKDHPTALVSTVTVDISSLIIKGAYTKNSIIFQGLDFKSTSDVEREPGADQILQNAGVTDLLEAARIEGLIAFGAIPQALRQTIGQPRTLDLSALYPAFDLGTAAKLFPVSGGEFLAIVPSTFTINQAAVCSCAPNVPLGTSASSSTLSVPPDPQNGQLSGQITIGGPLAQTINPLTDLGPRGPGHQGVAGVYMPHKTFEGLTVEVMPAVEVHASDDGFIGFDARGFIGFSNPAVSLDAVNGVIILDVDMDISVIASCSMDMLCFRLPIGRATITPAPGSQAHFTMGFYPAVDASGTVKLTPILRNIDMGTYVAILTDIGAALEVIGIAAWMAFLIDVVLSVIVSIEFPSVLKDQIGKYLANKEWVLLRFGDLIKQTFPSGRFEAPFDVDVDSFLASVDFSR